MASVIPPVHVESSRVTRLDLDDELTLQTNSMERGTRLTLSSRSSGGVVEFEVEFSAAGPLVRVRAATVELDAAVVTTDCDRYIVHARDAITFTSDGTIEQHSRDATTMQARSVTVDTTTGAIRLRANDDVQLLGEQVLLNCERKPPMPRWVPESREQMASLPPASTSGDDEVVAEMLGRDLPRK